MVIGRRKLIIDRCTDMRRDDNIMRIQQVQHFLKITGNQNIRINVKKFVCPILLKEVMNIGWLNSSIQLNDIVLRHQLIKVFHSQIHNGYDLK